MGRGVSQVRVFYAPSRVFPPRISDEEWQLSPRGKLRVDYANKCHPHERLTRREQALMCGWSQTYVQKWGQKKCKELKSQAQIKSGLFAAVQHLEKYTITRIKLLLWLLFRWSKPLYLCWLLQFNIYVASTAFTEIYGVFFWVFFGLTVLQEKGQAWAVSRIIPLPPPPLPQVRRKEAILRAAPACRGAEGLCCQRTSGDTTIYSVNLPRFCHIFVSGIRRSVPDTLSRRKQIDSLGEKLTLSCGKCVDLWSLKKA